MMSELKRILLAEDDENDIELTLRALREHNLANRVDVVRDGEEALNYIFRRGSYQNRSEVQPVVILLDLKMPKISGIDVLKQIKADEKLKMIPVVILTSSREDKDILHCYRLGVNAYVVKPVDFRQFIDSVKKLGLFWAVINEPSPTMI